MAEQGPQEFPACIARRSRDRDPDRHVHDNTAVRMYMPSRSRDSPEDPGSTRSPARRQPSRAERVLPTRGARGGKGTSGGACSSIVTARVSAVPFLCKRQPTILLAALLLQASTPVPAGVLAAGMWAE